jgi:membrane protease subunit (stomatin/prohibitin family)
MEKPIAQVIKYEGDNTTFIWKHPIEDFNTGSQLIVHESQEVLFYMNGQALDLFGPGRHMLESQNLPYVSKFFKRPMGDQTPFHCEVYYINKTEQMAIKWGTDSRVEYIEPKHQFPIKVGASGEMFLRAEDSRKLLVKIVGTENELSQKVLIPKIRGFLMTRVKTYLATLLRDKSMNIFEIDTQLSNISDTLLELLIPDFSDYGIMLEKFLVTTIVKPEEDKTYQKFRELNFRQYADVAEAELRQKVGLIEQQTQAQRMVIESQGLAQKRSIEGYNYQDERGFDVAAEIAKNEAVGSFTNIGTGLGMMAGVGGAIGSTVGGVVGNAMGQVQQKTTGNQTAQETPNKHEKQQLENCAKCSTPFPTTSKFCPECGEKRVEMKSTVTCPHCGSEVPVGKFCMECGGKL